MKRRNWRDKEQRPATKRISVTIKHKMMVPQFNFHPSVHRVDGEQKPTRPIHRSLITQQRSVSQNTPIKQLDLYLIESTPLTPKCECVFSYTLHY